jgi:aminopeptidase YwaD
MLNFQIMTKAFRFILFLFLIPVTLHGQADKISTSGLKKHVFFLASDSLKGRYPGTIGDKVAAEYIRDQFQKAGLQLLYQKGLQTFSIVTGIEPGPGNYLVIGKDSTLFDIDYRPMSFSSKGGLNAKISYIGYGIRVEHELFSWDDYHGIDVKGNWVFMLRGKPPVDNKANILDPISTDFGKAVFAKDMGAKGVIFVNPESTSEDLLESLSGFSGDAGIPVIQITRKTADMMLLLDGESIYNLETFHKKNLKPKNLTLKPTLNANVDLRETSIETFNVAGILRGQHPVLKNEYLVVGAHYDHLGMGGSGSGSRRPDTHTAHSGADDNASGVAAMIELARALSAERKNLQRSIIFVAFGAEEKGLLGSKFFVNSPPVELAKIKLMVNLDMLGRMKEDNSIQLGGTGTAKEMEELINHSLSNHKILLNTFPEGLGPSDHASFYGQDIPVLFFSTGPHMDYHTPEDTPDKVNYEGMKLVSDAIYELIQRSAKSDQKFTYTEAGPKIATQRHGQQRRVSLGLMPDFTAQGIEGLRADFVTKGKAAERGGMKNGDVIVAINGLSVKNIEEYMFRLSQLEPGQTINVEVIRENKKELLLIILD